MAQLSIASYFPQIKDYLSSPSRLGLPWHKITEDNGGERPAGRGMKTLFPPSDYLSDKRRSLKNIARV